MQTENEATEYREPFARLVSIDAWASDDGEGRSWSWNQSFNLREYTAKQVAHILADHKPRSVCAFLRREGYLSAESAGKVRVDYAGSDPDYITIEDKNTGEPIFAFIVCWDVADETTPDTHEATDPAEPDNFSALAPVE